MPEAVNVRCYKCRKNVAVQPPDEDHLYHTFDKKFVEGEKDLKISQFNHGACGFSGELYWYDIGSPLLVEPNIYNDPTSKF